MRESHIQPAFARAVTVCLTLCLAALFFGCAHHAHAQEVNVTSPVAAMPSFTLDSLLQNGIQNGGVSVTFGRRLKGDVNLAAIDYLYNMTSVAALIVGVDELKSPHGKQANVVKGGLQLKATIHPFASMGYTNFTAYPYAGILIATPSGGTSNNGGIGQISIVGVGIPVYTFKTKTAVYFVASYENRTGEGAEFNGNYGCIGLTYK